ncbi:ketopantoate reductase PanE/ApbA-domain-containing protein [Baffinella frigidus]|nr:ketopantoate reductase PanE/ApbA-domain-containing protein [Cryptophyta sp. CCMP2293]
MALFSGRTVLSRALRVVGVRHEHILSSIIGKTDPPAKWAVGPGEVGQVVVIGGGAIGSLMAGRIAAVPGMEKRVWMLTSWVEHAQAIAEVNGLVVHDERGGEFQRRSMFGQVKVVSDAEAILHWGSGAGRPEEMAQANVVIVAVKQSGMRWAADQAARILGGAHGGIAVTLLNGLGHIPTLQSAMRYHDVTGTMVHGVFTGGAVVHQPGAVTHTGHGAATLGLVGPKPDSLTLKLLDKV